MCAVREHILRIAGSDAAVAIIGESGSGKELAARDLHAHSGRSAHPFVAVNCGAIPETLMESEFFGHRRGAFTGAHEERGGFFQAAHRGTLFLDEVAELSATMQVKLLRVLQERCVRRLGGQREEPVDVRVVSATNRDLADAVRCGTFRQDLYYRLQVIELRLPPLRERCDDLPLLCNAILARLSGARPSVRPMRLSDAAIDRLRAHDFPGNVRELENILERALALTGGAQIEADDLHFDAGLRPVSPDTAEQLHAADGGLAAHAGGLNRPVRATDTGIVAAPPLPLSVPLSEHLYALERELVARALRESRYCRRRAAGLLGISLRQLRYRIQRLAIDELD